MVYHYITKNGPIPEEVEDLVESQFEENIPLQTQIKL